MNDIKIYTNVLEAKIAGRNALNDWALRLATQPIEVLKAFVGHKVINTTGLLTARIEKALVASAPLPDWTAGDKEQYARYYPLLQALYRSSDYSVYLWLRTCTNYHSRGTPDPSGGCVCTYDECNVHLGDISGCILTKLADLPSPEVYRTDYTVAQIAAARDNLRKAKAAVSQAESALCGFGEYDTM